jgi:hypothetical protein
MNTLTINGETYHVAVNWNAIKDYCNRRGLTDLSQLERAVAFDVDGALTMAHCCIREGERLAGREFTLTEEELGGDMTPIDVLQFMQIYANLSTPKSNEVRAESGEGRKKKKSRSR